VLLAWFSETKPNRTYPFGTQGAFGEPGAGGPFALADPGAGIGYTYATHQMGSQLGGDLRELAIREEFLRSIGSPNSFQPVDEKIINRRFVDMKLDIQPLVALCDTKFNIGLSGLPPAGKVKISASMCLP
jgi:hypothetical protein